MVCKNCGADDNDLRLDKRGLAEFYCKSCGRAVKKASTAEMFKVIKAFGVPTRPIDDPPKEPEKRMPCRYCTEDYFIRQGMYYYPFETMFCPRCGRELEEDDRKY